MFSSQIYAGELIINDSTPDEHHAPPDGMSTGLQLGLRTAPYGAILSAPAFPAELLIPSSEWQARIQEMEERKSRISDLCDQAGLPVKDQNGTNYCWINAPTHCVEIVRVVQGQPKVILSPASAGGPIKGFRNQGGWGQEGLEYIAEHGLCPVENWPANAIQRSYWTEANKAIALDYRVTEWMELRPRNVEQLISCLLRRIPVAIGLNWWGHEVTAVDAVWIDGRAEIRIDNSWGQGWSTNGRGILQGNKKLPDDAVAPRVALAKS